MSRNFTLVMAYFKNAGMLARQYEHWRGLPDDVKAAMEVIVCDDASPEGHEARLPDAPLGLDFTLFRISRKVEWNWIAARNIGAAHAVRDWLLLTDMDHLVPLDTLRRLISGELNEKLIYRFSRVDAPALTSYKPHPNSWFMTRRMFDKVGGFDERFSGCYGSDYDFRNRCEATAKRVEMLPEPLVRYPREVVADASTTDFDRKNSEYSARLPAARARIKAEGGPPLRLSFPYERVGGSVVTRPLDEKAA